MHDALARLALLLGVLVLGSAYSFVAAERGWFPHPQYLAAREAAKALWEARIRPVPFDRPARPGAPDRAGSRAHEPAGDDDVTLLVGYRPGGFAAWLVDRQGRELHRWDARFSEVFPRAPHLRWQARDEAIAWHGATVLANGDLVFNFQDANFPYGSGLVRLDATGRVVWALAENTHHDVTPDDRGHLWVPAMRVVEGTGNGNRHAWHYEDIILEVAPEDGRVLRRIVVRDALAAYPGLFGLTYADSLDIDSEDPLHLNNVDPLPEALAARFPLFRAGDLLISLRNINTIAVLDRESGRAKWVMTGPFVRQHDPDWLPDGRLLVFDNRGGDPACGGSRLLAIDPVTQEIETRYDGCGGPPFYTYARGMQQLLPDGRLLVAETHAGRAFELSADGRLLWEYWNVIGDGRVGILTHAERLPRNRFPFLAGSAGRNIRMVRDAARSPWE